MKNIKVTLVNGDYWYTRINGTDQEIINHYNDNNFFKMDINKHVKEIEIYFNDDELLPGQRKDSKKVYMFTYNQKIDTWLY